MRYTRPQPSHRIKHTKKQKMKESTQDVNVENPNVGKTTAAHRPQNVTMRGIQIGGTETMISLAPFVANGRLQWRQRPPSLSHSLCTQYALSNRTVLYNIKLQRY